ncbi:MAG: hypothetical protein JWR16_2800 [Nevskia sp.]|nr:hypothetical protein [Nevskia sp.]
MADLLLSRALTWGLCLLCLLVFGISAALYFAFCSFTLGLIYTRQWRPGAEAKLRAQGLGETECDLRMLPQDRLVAIARAAISVAVAWGFHRYA